MREFNIIERKDSYYLCEKDSGYCRIVIDDNSQNLPLGRVMLHVEEISDRYTHHTKESVFRLTLPFEQQHDSIAICTLATGRKNTFIYQRCLQLGGKWEPILNEWVFSASVQTQVDELAAVIHSEEAYLEVTFKETISVIEQPLTLYGYPLIKALTNNHQVILHNGIKLVDGDLARMQTPSSQQKTTILANSKIRLSIPSAMQDNILFHEDYLCAVNVEKTRKPRQKKPFLGGYR